MGKAMAHGAAREFDVWAVHWPLIRELASYVSWIFISGLAACTAAWYGGGATYGTAARATQEHGDRLRRAFAIDREAACGIHDIENYLAHRDTPA